MAAALFLCGTVASAAVPDALRPAMPQNDDVAAVCPMVPQNDSSSVAGSSAAECGTEFPRFELRVSWAGYPVYGGLAFNTLGYRTYKYWEQILMPSELYSDYASATRITGNIGVSFDWNLKRWLTMSFGVSVNTIWAELFDAQTNASKGVRHNVYGSFVPMARFTYFSKGCISLYSAAGLGIAVGPFSNNWKVLPHIQTVPFGMAVGGRVYGFAQAELGTLNVGGSFGVGVKF